LKVLLIEPDSNFSEEIEKDISEWGYDLVTVKSIKEAIEVIKNEEIRILILEWVVPGEDPARLCRLIRDGVQEEAIKNIFIILLADKACEYDLTKALSAGADDYLLKPFSFLELKIHLNNGQRMIVLEDNFYRLVSFDVATDLWNKGKIIEFLDQELNRGWREEKPTGIIKLDIDNFKQINDTYGYFIGDKVLAEVGSRLKRFMRPYDKIGRYGGDEMLIVLPNCSLEKVSQIAERFRSCVYEKKIEVEAAQINVSISLGGTSWDNLTRALAANLIRYADKALYAAKKGGRNRAFVIKPTPLV